jgi:hypothetical protein
MKIILLTVIIGVMSGCAYNTLEEMQQKMAMHYLSSMGDEADTDTSVPDILKPVEPVVYGPEENPDKD